MEDTGKVEQRLFSIFLWGRIGEELPQSLYVKGIDRIFLWVQIPLSAPQNGDGIFPISILLCNFERDLRVEPF